MFKMIANLIMFIALLLGIFVFGFLMGGGTVEDIYFTEDAPKTVEDITIIYGDEMNETEKLTFKIIVDELNPLYIEYIKSIRVGKNRTELELNNKECLEAYKDAGCGGKTRGGDIIVGWASVNSMKIILCHEILHDFIPTKSNKAILGLEKWIHEDAKHAVIEHQGRKKVCFG